MRFILCLLVMNSLKLRQQTLQRALPDHPAHLSPHLLRVAALDRTPWDRPAPPARGRAQGPPRSRRPGSGWRRAARRERARRHRRSPPRHREKSRPRAGRPLPGRRTNSPSFPSAARRRCQSGGQEQGGGQGGDGGTPAPPAAGRGRRKRHGQGAGNELQALKIFQRRPVSPGRSARRSHPMDQDCFFMVFLSVKAQHGPARPVQARHHRAERQMSAPGRSPRRRVRRTRACTSTSRRRRRQAVDGPAHDGDLLVAAGEALRGAGIDGVPFADRDLGPAHLAAPRQVQAGVAGDAQDPGLRVGGPVVVVSGPAPWRTSPGPGRGRRPRCRRTPGTGRRPGRGRQAVPAGRVVPGPGQAGWASSPRPRRSAAVRSPVSLPASYPINAPAGKIFPRIEPNYRDE